jgi:hypothetical protein
MRRVLKKCSYSTTSIQRNDILSISQHHIFHDEFHLFNLALEWTILDRDQQLKIWKPNLGRVRLESADFIPFNLRQQCPFISRFSDLDAIVNTHSVSASLIGTVTKSRHTRKRAYRIPIDPIIPESWNRDMSTAVAN